MAQTTKTLRVLSVAALLATGSEAFVSQKQQHLQQSSTQLNSMWRNWIPQTTDFLELAVGEKSEPTSREFVVDAAKAQSDKTSEFSAEGQQRRSLVSSASSRTTEESSSPLAFSSWSATAATAALLVATSVSFAPASFAVSGGGLDFAGLDISNQDFSKQNFKGKDFTQVLARNTNFAGSNLAGCRFPKAYLINANYEGADIRGVSFEGTNLENANLKVSENIDDNIVEDTERRDSRVDPLSKNRCLYQSMKRIDFELTTQNDWKIRIETLVDTQS